MKKPDGRPLYAYRVNADELQEFQRTLASELIPGHYSDDATAAAFCLFAAAHFWRTYRGGVWAWRSILEAIGYSGSYTELYDPIERGLSYWRRRLILSADTRSFLVTLACEGGLPLELLRQPDKEPHIRRYLRELVQACEVYSTPAAQLVASYADILPSSLRNDLVWELTAKLVDAVVHLRKQVQGQPDPIGSLDTQNPGWRTNIPLPLDDIIARALLDGLLRAQSNLTSRPNETLRVETLLRTEGRLRIQRKLGGPPCIPHHDLAELLQVSADTLPARIYMHLTTADGNRTLAAIASASGSSECAYDIQYLGGKVIADPAVIVEQIFLVATVGGRDIACIQPPGGESLEAFPWIFAGGTRSPAHPFIGMGDYRTRADSVLIAVNNTDTLIPSHNARIEDWGEIPELGRIVKWAEGSLQCESQDGAFTISTKHPNEEGTRFSLVGKLRHSASTSAGFEAWLGPPEVREMEDQRWVRRVDPEAIEWRPRSINASWRRLDSTALGAGHIRVIRDGRQLFRTSCTILPPDLELLVIVKEDMGQIRVSSTQLRDVGADVPIEQKLQMGSAITVSFQSSSPPLPFLEISLRFASGGEAQLRVTYPQRTIMFSGRGGAVLNNNDRVSLDALSLIRARAISHIYRENFVLEARLEHLGWMPIQPLYDIGDGCFELPLDTVRDTIRAALAASLDLDDFISLRIVGTLECPPTTINVGWYDGYLLKEILPDGNFEVVVPEPVQKILGDDIVKGLRLVARPLLEPESQEIELLKADRGWIFNTQGKIGPHFILCLHGDMLRLRPRVIRELAPIQPNTPFESAMCLPERTERWNALASVIETVANDFGHPDWHRLDGFLRTVSIWPASTFEVVRTIANRPEAAVMALLKASSKDFDRLWDGMEHLSLLWALIPVRA